jgi:hypothetical protein
MPAPVLIADESLVPSLDIVEADVLSGLKHDAERMDAALVADNYYRGRGLQYLEKRPGETDAAFEARPKRTSRLTYEVARLVSRQLWPTHPQREVESDAGLAKWWQEILADTQADVRLAAADRAALLGHASAVEIEATGDPARPARLFVWKPHEFTVWCRDDDPTDVWAICTRSLVRDREPGKMRARLRLWSALERRTYYSRPFGFGESAAGRVVYLDPAESGLSPYPGVLPFTFVRHEHAVSEFWEGGIGGTLVECNGEADRALSDLAQHVAEFLNPARYAIGMPAEARLNPQPDGFLHLPMLAAMKMGDMNQAPQLGYLQANLAVSEAWEDLRSYVDQTLEELGIPATLVRTSSSSTDLSGVAIVAKQVPFFDHARQRQPLANEIETDLFARTCAVVGTWHNDGRLLSAAAAPKIVVTWPEPKIPLPTAERDTADEWELTQGMTDPIEVLARRRGITIAQAEELAGQIAERRKKWAAMMGEAAQAEMDAQPVDPAADPNADPEDEPDDV